MNGPQRRVCFLRHGYFPQDVRVKRQVDALLEYGYDVDVLCLKRDGQRRRETIGHLQVFRLPVKLRRGTAIHYLFEYATSFMIMFLRLSWLSLWKRYACVQVSTMPDVLVFATGISRLLGARILLDMREPMPELFVTKFGDNRMNFMVRLQAIFERLAIRYSDYVITVNDTIRQRFIDRGADANKIGIVRNVPGEDLIPGASPAAHIERFTIGMHGTMQARYAYDCVLRSLPILRGRIPGLNARFIGSGQTLAELQQLSQHLGCADIVIFEKRVPFLELAPILSSLHIGIVSLSPTPFSALCQPNKLFDYIALGIPVISSRIKAIEETFDDSCITFFEPGNPDDLARCIWELYSDPVRRRNQAEAAFDRYKMLRWQVTKHDYVRCVSPGIHRDLPAQEIRNVRSAPSGPTTTC